MNFKEWDFSEQSWGDLEAVVYDNGIEIARLEVPSRLVSESSSRDTVNEINETIAYEELELAIRIIASSSGVYIAVEASNDYFDMNNLEVDLAYKEEEKKVDKFKLDFYMPVLSYTRTTSSLLYGITDENVVPLIDITQKDRFDDYNEDELIDFLHYLDMNGVERILNEERRNEVKNTRKDEKRSYGKASTPIPDPEYGEMSLDEVIALFKSIKNKVNVIPCFTWGLGSDLKALKLFYNSLNNEFDKLALRIVDFTGLKYDLEKIHDLYNFHIILDMNTNNDVNMIQGLIDLVQSCQFDFIIYLGTPFGMLDISMSVSRNEVNINNIKMNIPLKIQMYLYANEYNIKYGDYCGYDRRTLISHPKGGTPTARVVLLSLEPTETILIRRGWDSRDKIVRPGYRDLMGAKHSMTRLLKDIQEGKLDKENGIKYLDAELIDADHALKEQYPINTSAGNIKTFCLRHNIMALKHCYIKSL